MKDYNIADLLGRWKNGNRKAVIDILEEEHPGLVAAFIVMGIKHADGALRLDVADCNAIANLLSDRRTEVFQKPLDARHRVVRIMGDNLYALAAHIEETCNPGEFYNSEIAEMRGAANLVRGLT